MGWKTGPLENFGQVGNKSVAASPIVDSSELSSSLRTSTWPSLDYFAASNSNAQRSSIKTYLISWSQTLSKNPWAASTPSHFPGSLGMWDELGEQLRLRILVGTRSKMSSNGMKNLVFRKFRVTFTRAPLSSDLLSSSSNVLNWYSVMKGDYKKL